MGQVEGAFFGDAGEPPKEAGFVYELGDPAAGPYLTGGAALGLE